MAIDTTVTFEVHCSDYSYTINTDDEFSVEYREADQLTSCSSIGFGSIDEMEAVANAMLRAARLYRDM